jgi:hypothetical protein
MRAVNLREASYAKGSLVALCGRTSDGYGAGSIETVDGWLCHSSGVIAGV